MPFLTGSVGVDYARFTRVMDGLDAVAANPTESGSPLRAGLEEAAGLYAAETQKRFNRASQGDGTWPKLAPSTVARKKRRVLFPELILWMCGDLNRSLTVGGVNNIYDVLEDRIRYGTRDPKAGYHQAGGGRLPQRTILVPPTEAQLKRCTAPIVSAWRTAINAVCAAA